MFQKSIGRLVAGTAALAAVVVLSLAFFPTPASAGGGSNCFELMENGVKPKSISIPGGTYTFTIPIDQSVCLATTSKLLLGFTSVHPFAVDTNIAVAYTTGGYIVPLKDITGDMAFKLSGSGIKLEMTPDSYPATVVLWLGKLKDITPTPTPTAPSSSVTTMDIVGPGPLAKGTFPEWGEFTPITQTMSIEVQARVPFTITSSAGGSISAISCGIACWKGTWDIGSGEGKLRASELVGYWWSATLVGEPTARVLMPATTSAVSPDPARKPGGGAASGAAPEVWGAPPPAQYGPPPRPWWGLN